MSHYFENDQTLKSEEKIKKVMINNQSFDFITDNGVFSKKGLDFGTRTLLENLPLDEIKGKVLDFGCGYGPIGIYLSKNTDAEIQMIDINKRSIALALKNASLNKCIVDAYYSETYSTVKEKFNFIITNPPIRVGKKILYEILFDAYDYLYDNGELWIVINKNQGAKSLLKDLEQKYKTTLIIKNKGFYIIKAKKTK